MRAHIYSAGCALKVPELANWSRAIICWFMKLCGFKKDFLGTFDNVEIEIAGTAD
jgi:hypothetical protein